MSESTISGSCDDLRTVDDLRVFVHQTLCGKEGLLSEQFPLSEMALTRRNRFCGLQFSLQGPREVRLGAIWAADHNVVYFYDARGERYLKIKLARRLSMEPLPQREAA
jgi:hypothetical protein